VKLYAEVLVILLLAIVLLQAEELCSGVLNLPAVMKITSQRQNIPGLGALRLADDQYQ
jgi:hypothetical protein